MEKPCGKEGSSSNTGSRAYRIEGLPAFTFGGTGDGLPTGVSQYLSGRDIIILADNDNTGRQHAVRKAEAAHSVAASVRIVEFPDLPEKQDVSDFLKQAAVSELVERARQAPVWSPSPKSEHRVTSHARELVTCTLSDIQPEKIDWLWPGRIAIGKLTILAGEPGLGKSQLGIYVASTVTRGHRWVGSDERPRRGRVIMLSAEDGLADTVRPRFDAAGGDPSMVSIIRATRSGGATHGTFNLAADLSLLEQEIGKYDDVELVSIDPVSAYLPNVDSHNNTAIRAVLQPIAELAERLKVAFLATTHFSKGEGKAINRVIGSIAFVAAARTAFAVVEDPDEPGRRLLLPIKNNIARAQPGLAFRLEQREVAPGIIGSAVAWEEGATVNLTADQALSGTGHQPSVKDDAVAFLLELLADGPMAVREIEKHAFDASLLADGKPLGQAKPFRLARDELGIKPQRTGGLGQGGQWVWGLPADSKMPSDPYDAPVQGEGTLGGSGHLKPTGGEA